MSLSHESDVIFSSKVQATAAKEGITLDSLKDMVHKAALITSELGNRRYHQWLFTVVKGVVLKMNRPAYRIVKETGSEARINYDECEHCEGAGCTFCGYIGEVRYEVRKE